MPDTLSPNQRTALLARRWREERNFWIACLTFLLWGLLYRMFLLMLEHTALRDRVRYLEAVVAKVPAPAVAAAAAAAAPSTATAGGGKGGGAGGGKGGGGGKGVDVEPSAPPAPVEAKKTK
ncbi:hypothetical protein TSOC_012946 [Tetrabaena socialis]|uniref:BAP29/BAP31 transmembrane domain-containing protein n=1 Tax=Tetrabaena socialis TaxID=47790 RepID=A0A2J7ZLN2_9CHLO|nr:hypothetical protein TSOC_012946 [Tetrabaena socialis]|eukprot:PNH01181.1 hypothetical protein TSOC_012946 [Tetrabaena socialis]